MSRSRHAVPRLPWIAAAFACALALSAPLAAQEEGTGAPAAGDAAATAPAPEGAAAPAPASSEVAGYTLPPEKYQEAVEYARARYTLYFAGFAWGLVVLVGILAFRVAPRFRDWAERASGRRSIQVAIFAPLILLTQQFLELPTGIYGQHLARRYNQSIQGWTSWSVDWAKGALIGLIIGTFLISILYGIIRRSPRRWWFYFWLASLPIIVFLLFISPVLIDPLFFKFTPLEGKQPALVQEIEKVVERGGLEIPRERMFEMNASSKLKSVNAYVTGFGASKRVVVWDNTVARMTVPQTLFVFGHEMGHYVLKHIPKILAFTALFLFMALFAGYRGLGGILRRFGPRLGIRGADDWASFPVLLLLISIFSFVAQPAFNSFSRTLEHEADIYGLEVTNGIVADRAAAAGEAFQILGEINLSDPDPHPFIRFWMYSHPTINERVIFARTYDPWSKGEPAKFVEAKPETAAEGR